MERSNTWRRGQFLFWAVPGEYDTRFSLNPDPSPSRPTDRLVQETLERRQAEKTLRLVLQGASGVAGSDFFRLLTQYLGAALEVDLAFIAEISPNKPGHARTLALLESDDFQKPFEYELAGTPCEHVLRNDKAYFAGSVATRFPEDVWLVEHRIESYHGVPLLDAAGDPIGHMGVMHRQPMPMTIPREAILRVFAARAGAELDRQRATRHLEVIVERYRTLVDMIPLGVREVALDGTITFVNPVHEKMYGFKPDEMVGMSVLELVVDEDDRNRLTDLIRELVENEPPPTPYFTKHLTKAGSTINVQVDWNYKRDVDGLLTGFTAIVTELDELPN